MDTTKSEAKAAAYLADKPGLLNETRTYSRRLAATADAIFPLLCPTRELDWIPGWDCDMLHTETGYAEAGVVFRTLDQGGDRIWYCDTYQPDFRIGYLSFLPDQLTRLIITLEEADGGTDVTFTYTRMALNEAGNVAIGELATGDADPHRMLPVLIEEYLAG